MTKTNQLRHALARLIGYQTRGRGFEKIHYSLTYSNAIRWAHCYQEATVTRRGKFIAATKTRT
jgi:hypothetical protein